jgi:hypothetical protein
MVCPNCGVTVRYLTPEYDYHKQPLFTCSYSRKKRFDILLSRVLLPCFEPHDAGMFEFLDKTKPYISVEEIMNQMKLSKLKDKRYCSIHLFARYFMTGYRAPKHELQFHRTLMFSFREVERNFYRFKNIPFFNYPWLLRRLFLKHGLVEYIHFVKPIRCDKRNAHYDALFCKIMNGNISLEGPDTREKSRVPISERENDHVMTLYQKIASRHCVLNNLPDGAGKNLHIGYTLSRFSVDSPSTNLTHAVV